MEAEGYFAKEDEKRLFRETLQLVSWASGHVEDTMFIAKRINRKMAA